VGFSGHFGQYYLSGPHFLTHRYSNYQVEKASKKQNIAQNQRQNQQ